MAILERRVVVVRWPRRPGREGDLAARSSLKMYLSTIFTGPPLLGSPAESAPVDWSKPEYENIKVKWR